MSLRPVTLIAFLVAALALAALLVVATFPAPSGPGDGGFDRRVRAYLMTHPEVIIEAVESLRQRGTADQAARQRAALRANRAALLSSGPLPVAGNPSGDVTVVEFFDYRCPYCRQAVPEVKALLAADRNIRVVYKEFPVLGPESLYASRVAVAAALQGKYAAVHDALMSAREKLTETTIRAVVTAAGADWARIEADMERPEVAKVIRDNLSLARHLAINGTPTFIIGDEVIPGYAPAATMIELVHRVRSLSGKR